MRLSGNETSNLTTSLLAAHPALLDPNFRRTIIFLIKHDPSEGAMGVILNRPHASRLDDFGNALGESIPEGLGKVRVFEGGPVEKRQLILARMIVADASTSFESLGKEDLGKEDGEALPGDLPEGELRAFVGYSGWSEGQLEHEIAEKSWVTLPPSPELFTPAKSPSEGEDLWRSVMKSLGPRYHLMATAPDDLSVN